MRLVSLPRRRIGLSEFSRPRSMPALNYCRCFLCEHESGIPLPLSKDQPNWIECERCGIDNEIPADAPDRFILTGRVPTRFF